MKAKTIKLNRLLDAIVLLLPFAAVMTVLLVDVFISSHIIHRLPSWLIGGELILLCLGIPLGIHYLLRQYITRPLEAIGRSLRTSEASPQVRVREIHTIAQEVEHLNARLQEEEELRKNLISDTSHELNTPLASLLAELAAAKDGLYKLDKRRVEGLYQTTERLITVVAQLDDYAKARVPLKQPAENIYPRELCKRSVQALNSILSANNFTVQVTIPEDYKVHVHPRTLEQILHNLIYNAVLHSGGNHIQISMPTPNTLAFEDNGHGVPAQDLPHLFERFYRGSQPYADKDGMGLGLSIVKELADREGWRLAVQNGDPGLILVFSGIANVPASS